jgi:hypothetical protein
MTDFAKSIDILRCISFSKSALTQREDGEGKHGLPSRAMHTKQLGRVRAQYTDFATCSF